MVKALTLDSSVLVAALRKTEEKHKECLLLMKKVKEGDYVAIEPFTVLVEVVAAIRRRTGSQEIALEVKQELLKIDNLRFLDIDRVAAEAATDIAAETGVRGMDAIVIQTAKEYGTILISLDKELIEGAKEIVKTGEISEFSLSHNKS
jgi:predicted nucleic acid-binding protein